MKVEDFEEALTEIGAEYYHSGQSIRLKECPECGRRKYSVIIDVTDEERKVFLGRCVRGSCMQGYSSASYLRKMGMEEEDISSFHGFNPFESFRKAFGAQERKKVDFFKGAEDEPKEFVDTDISGFMNPERWKDHPAAKYAYKRGYDPHICRDNVLIDPDTSSVVFVCRDREGVVMGFQRRFTSTVGDGPKTKTSQGFKAHSNLLIFRGGNKGVAICEGPFTALSAAHWGFVGVCTFGANVSAEQLGRIFDFADRANLPVLAAKENDDAGDKCYKAIYGFAKERGKKVEKIVPDSDQDDDLNDSWMAGRSYKILPSEEIDFLMPVFKFC